LAKVRVSLQAKEYQGRRGACSGALLLLKAVENLTLEEAGQLTRLWEVYPELRRASGLKEAFRAWYRTSGREQAERGLALWEASVREQGIGAFQSLLPMIKRWRQEILNYFDHPYTNGFVEGKNNRIKVIKRLAYGYRNRANFRQRIFLTNRKEHNPKVHEAPHTY
jgi:transposase